MSFFRVIVNLFQFNRTNWKAVSLCAATAIIFWFFSALNKNYQTNLRFPVQFNFDRERFIPVEALPENVFMNVSGNGWDLLRKSVGFRVPPMILSLDRPTEVKKVVGSTLPALLAGQLGNLQINYVVTDTLYLNIDPIDEHLFKVAVDDSEITFREGYGRLSPIVVLPDSIKLTGPEKILHELPGKLVIKISDKEINENYREEIEVPVGNDHLIQRNPPVVEVIFEVGEFDEIDHKIKLELSDVRNKRVNVVRDSVKCTLYLPRNKIEDLRNLQPPLVATISVGELTKGNHFLMPQVHGLPTYAKLTSIDSVALKLY